MSGMEEKQPVPMDGIELNGSSLADAMTVPETTFPLQAAKNDPAKTNPTRKNLVFIMNLLFKYEGGRWWSVQVPSGNTIIIAQIR
jgi:hypothetical protein